MASIEVLQCLNMSGTSAPSLIREKISQCIRHKFLVHHSVPLCLQSPALGALGNSIGLDATVSIAPSKPLKAVY